MIWMMMSPVAWWTFMARPPAEVVPSRVVPPHLPDQQQLPWLLSFPSSCITCPSFPVPATQSSWLHYLHEAITQILTPFIFMCGFHTTLFLPCRIILPLQLFIGPNMLVMQVRRSASNPQNHSVFCTRFITHNNNTHYHNHNKIITKTYVHYRKLFLNPSNQYNNQTNLTII
jgi:hypothetical protein